jgi:dihydrodiol dehydrogenase / D-xylose 1-dehydrogenase (NADP)
MSIAFNLIIFFIEVVYIGTLHSVHLEQCKLIMDKGKHILCEKPLAMNVKETKELVEYARKKKVFFMEVYCKIYL